MTLNLWHTQQKLNSLHVCVISSRTKCSCIKYIVDLKNGKQQSIQHCEYWGIKLEIYWNMIFFYTVPWGIKYELIHLIILRKIEEHVRPERKKTYPSDDWIYIIGSLSRNQSNRWIKILLKIANIRSIYVYNN